MSCVYKILTSVHCLHVRFINLYCSCELTHGALLRPYRCRDMIDAWLKRLRTGAGLFEEGCADYNSDDDHKGVVGCRVSAPFMAGKGSASGGEVWCVCRSGGFPFWRSASPLPLWHSLLPVLGV